MKMLYFPPCRRLSSIVSRRLSFIAFNVRPLLLTSQFSSVPNTNHPVSTLNSNIKFDTRLEVDTYIRDNLTSCTKENLCDFITKSAESSKSNTNVSFLINHLPKIAVRIRELASLNWNFWEIASLISSLQHVVSNEKGGMEILSVMATVAGESFKNEDSMKSLQGKHIAKLLCGLQNLDSSEDETKDLLSVVLLMIRDCKEIITVDEISDSLYGLKGMNSTCAEVLNILSALALRIHNSNEEFTAENLSDAFYGLQGLNSDKPGMRELLAVLSLKIRSCKEDFNAQEIGKIMYGLKGMRSNSEEVRDVLSALTIKVLNCKEDFKAQDVGHSLYGLQGFSRNCTQVNELLSALSSKVLSCKGNLTTQNVSDALYGLHGIKCNRLNNSFYLPVLDFLHSQTKNFMHDELKSKESIDSRDSSVNESNDSSLTSTSELVKLGQTLTFVLPELAEILPIGVYYSWKKINMDVSDELERRKNSGDKYYKHLKFRSNIDRNTLKRVYDILEEAFDNTETKMSSNVHLCDLFLCDIVMEIYLQKTPDEELDTNAVVNVEIDGVHHRQDKNKLFGLRRDKYLKSRDVVIVRIDISTLEEMNDEELEKWVVKTIVMQL